MTLAGTVAAWLPAMTDFPINENIPSIELYMFKPHHNVVPGYVIVNVATRCRAYQAVKPVQLNGLTLGCINDTIVAKMGNNLIHINTDIVNSLREDHVYVLSPKDGSLHPVEVRLSNVYMRLHFPRDVDAPTLMINGIHMHRVSGIGPLSDARHKVIAARVRHGHTVLDICTGLGYTAITSLEFGAKQVYTIEVSREVLAIAEFNPWSAKLADNRVKIMLGDASRLIEFFPDSTFDRIIHDPPRFSIAGELYSNDFYRELYRVLRPGGVLFHYTGEPLRSRGHGHGPIVRGVIQRLRGVGFLRIRYDKRAQGVVAVKPRY